jgi:hypothetical protein
VNGRQWTYPEVVELRRLYPTRTAAAIGKRIGRSESAVKNRARRLGLRVKVPPGTHDAAVRRMHRRGCFDWEIALAIDRTQQQVARIRKRLGLAAHRGQRH